MIYAVILFVISFLIFLYLECRKPKNFPPGPPWLPIFGSALSMRKERNRTTMLAIAAHDITKRYSKGLSGYKIGRDLMVFCLSSAATRELYCNEDFDGRPKGLFFQSRTWFQRRGVLFTDDEFWQEQRRFIMRHLKEFGFARRGMMELIQSETNHLLNDIKKTVKEQGGKALMPMQNIFIVYILNTLWSMMAGIRFDRDNMEVRYLQSLLNDLLQEVDMTGALFSHFPILRFLAPEFSGYNRYLEVHVLMFDFIERAVNKHKIDFKVENEPRDLLDAYLRELKSADKKDSFSEKQLMAICLDLFLAGSETTNKTLSFGFLQLVRNFDLQIKAQEEIDRVVGRERLPQLDDRPNMPYIEALVLESLRLFMSFACALPHRATKDTKLNGYDIPKDTMVVCCFRDLMTDEKVWGDTSKFNPDRFLKNGKIVIPDQYFPFGMGKRRCLGEVLARSNLFLFFATMLQHFSFMVPEGHDLPSEEPVDGATPNIKEYTALIVPR